MPPRTALPSPPRYRPQLALLVDAAPRGDDWLHEHKIDGYRIGCRIVGGKVQLISRRDKDWTASFPAIADAAKTLKCINALLDGEAAILMPDGRTSFQALQNAFETGSAPQAVYFAFDLLFLDGADLSRLPLEERKEKLRDLVGTKGSVIRYVDHIIGRGPEVFAAAAKLGLEGIVSKRRHSTYAAGKRDASWVKTKILKRQELVIGGFTDPEKSRQGLGALLMGYYDGDGKLHYAGKVGTGFTHDLLLKLRAQLNRIEQPSWAFAAKPPLPAAGLHWVSPVLVAEVAFSEWTNEGTMRHPSFQGLRLDKAANDVRREMPAGER